MTSTTKMQYSTTKRRTLRCLEPCASPPVFETWAMPSSVGPPEKVRSFFKMVSCVFALLKLVGTLKCGIWMLGDPTFANAVQTFTKSPSTTQTAKVARKSRMCSKVRSTTESRYFALVCGCHPNPYGLLFFRSQHVFRRMLWPQARRLKHSFFTYGSWFCFAIFSGHAISTPCFESASCQAIRGLVE